MQRTIISDTVIPPEEATLVAVDENVIADHLEKYLEALDNKERAKVYHSVFGGVHIYCFPPSELLKRKHWTLITMGISGTKMNVPQDIDDPESYQHCELIMYLPGDWNMPAALGGPVNAENWPFEILRSMATYVSRTRAWVSYDHGLPNLLTDPSGTKFLPDIEMTHVILLEPVFEADGFGSVITPTGAIVNFFVVIPLTAAEAAWKREVGAANSIHIIVGSKEIGGDSVAVDVIVDPHRPCAVKDLHIPEQLLQEDSDDDSSEGSALEDTGDLDTASP